MRKEKKKVEHRRTNKNIKRSAVDSSVIKKRKEKCVCVCFVNLVLMTGCVVCVLYTDKEEKFDETIIDVLLVD
jgi:hypothetical protein